MPDITFIHPGAQHGIYGSLGDTLTALEPPPWTRMLAANARDHGYSVSIVDMEAQHLDAKMSAARILHDIPQLVVVVVAGHQPSASTQQMVGASAVAKMVKAYLPSTRILMCGNHPSALPERTLREERVDFVCDGEGPATIDGLMNLDDLETIPGLVWWRGDKVIRNPLAPLIENLDKDLSGKAWDLLPPLTSYRSHQWQCFGDLSKRTPYASIYSSLGCPFKCSFCMINAFQHTNRYRRRSPESVVEELRYLYEEHGVSTVKFADEMFVLAENHYVPICQKLVNSGLGEKLNVWCYSRVDSVKEGHLDLMRRAGIRWLALGIESGSKYVRDGAQKALRNDDIVGVVRQIQTAGIHVIGNFIYGLEHDDLHSMQETLALATECNCEFANFYCAMPYPGSKLYDDAVRTGARLPSSWRNFSQHNDGCEPMDTEHITRDVVLRFRDQAFLQYFQRDSYLSMIEATFGKATVAHINDMCKYKLKRKLLEPA